MNISEKLKKCGKVMKTFSDAFSYTIGDSIWQVLLHWGGWGGGGS